MERLAESLPDTVDARTRTALADALAANRTAAGAGRDVVRLLRAVLLRPVRPGLLVDLCADPSVPVHLRYNAAHALTDDTSGPGRAAARDLYEWLAGHPESSDDLVADAVTEVEDVRVVEQVVRDERRSMYARTEALRRLIELDETALAEDLVHSLAATGMDPWAAHRVAESLRDLGHPTASRQVLLDSLGSSDANSFVRTECAQALVSLGALAEVRRLLEQMAADRGVAASERLNALDTLAELDPVGVGTRVAEFALDHALPGDVRHWAACIVLATGNRDLAAQALRRVAEDRHVGMRDRIDALTDLAEVDTRAASDTLHQILDESGAADEHRWRLLDLADALAPDTTLRRRLVAMLDDETTRPVALLGAPNHCPHTAAIVPRIRKAMQRIVDDPTSEPGDRAHAVHRMLALIPYRRWRTLMAELGQNHLHTLGLHGTVGSHSYLSAYPGVFNYLSFRQEGEHVTAPVGHLAGVDFDLAVAEWQGLLARRRPEAVTRLGHLYGLLHDPDTREHVRLQLLDWAQDATAPVEERIAAAERVFAYPRAPWFTLAADPATPPRLRLAICAQLPSAGRHNRIPLARALATDSSLPTEVRAPAAALLAYDLGEEGRRLLQEFSAPGRGVAEAHLAVGAAWEELDVGVEAVAAYQRVLKDERADARHRVDAAARLARWREARGTARQALRAVLYGERAPVAARVDAAEHLVAMHEPAEAHLGLLRLTLERSPESAERDRITGMLPADLRTVATRLSDATSAAASA
ncbi:hypothetical protein [Streptomyces tendae]|uniref:hypothetical protein n=1 Tax=Streptomyces tendae TaxID=1932 RepID=UPI00369018AE